MFATAMILRLGAFSRMFHAIAGGFAIKEPLQSQVYGLLVGVVSNVVIEATLSEHVQSDEREKKEMDDRAALSNKIVQMILLLDANKDGELTAEEIDGARHNPEIYDLLRQLDIPHITGAEMVSILDKSGDGFISYDEFRDSLIEMNNPIRARDYVMMQMRVQEAAERVKQLERKLEAISLQVFEVCRKYKEAFAIVNKWIAHKEVPELVAKAKHYCRMHVPGSGVAKAKDWDKIRPRTEEDLDDPDRGRAAVRYLGKILNLPTSLPNMVSEAGAEAAFQWQPHKPEKRKGHSLPEAPPIQDLRKQTLEVDEDHDPFFRHKPLVKTEAFESLRSDIASELYPRGTARGWL
eukprot:TRINITY_DN32086_c0_g2_i1.p1 TRINITY_DN32086_c0_g2~~TRINITY_DN32086_c0_g2_i1.p1  ORF type:complete len:350 (+),score=54.48 TRINITY_DN32086_c0_g2_i1:1-1050(+)